MNVISPFRKEPYLLHAQRISCQVGTKGGMLIDFVGVARVRVGAMALAATWQSSVLSAFVFCTCHYTDIRE